MATHWRFWKKPEIPVEKPILTVEEQLMDVRALGAQIKAKRAEDPNSPNDGYWFQLAVLCGQIEGSLLASQNKQV